MKLIDKQGIICLLTAVAIVACLGYSWMRTVTIAAIDSQEFPDTAVEGEIYIRELPGDKLLWYVFNGDGWVEFNKPKQSAIDSRREGEGFPVSTEDILYWTSTDDPCDRFSIDANATGRALLTIKYASPPIPEPNSVIDIQFADPNGSDDGWSISRDIDGDIHIEGLDLETAFKHLFYFTMGDYDPNEHLMSAKLVFDEPNTPDASVYRAYCPDCGQEIGDIEVHSCSAYVEIEYDPNGARDYVIALIREEIEKMAEEGRLLLLDPNGVLKADLVAYWEAPEPPNSLVIVEPDSEWRIRKGARIYFEKENSK